jgi:hypothetical protein
MPTCVSALSYIRTSVRSSASPRPPAALPVVGDAELPSVLRTERGDQPMLVGGWREPAAKAHGLQAAVAVARSALSCVSMFRLWGSKASPCMQLDWRAGGRLTECADSSGGSVESTQGGRRHTMCVVCVWQPLCAVPAVLRQGGASTAAAAGSGTGSASQGVRPRHSRRDLHALRCCCPFNPQQQHT